MNANAPAKLSTSTSVNSCKFNEIVHRITGKIRGQSISRNISLKYVHVCVDDHYRVAFALIM